MCRVDDKEASFRINLALANIAPIKGYDTRVCIRTWLLNPSERGFPTKEEAQTLYDIEDALINELEAKGAVFAGTVKSDGWLDFWLYAKDVKDYETIMNEKFSLFKGYKCSIDIKNDAQWETYFEYLYPDDYNYSYSCMQNFKVLRNLADNGDNASLPRDVDHFIDFDSEKDMENFGQKIAQIGYKILSKQPPREDLKKFSINTMRNQNLENIDEDTWELINLAKDFSGVYDGWGCPIAK
ncbi:MAG: DUF695 domain-containing protein [Campylobacter curvus]